MSQQEHIQCTFMVSASEAGEPYILVLDGGRRLQIYPHGGSSSCLFISPGDWRKLNTAVEAAIRADTKARVGEALADGMAASPVIATSPVLADYLACEGIEVPL
ncbi:hypothetical protein [Mycolicibacterium vaccae]|uniref:hypothetical protein n=1 Tax=Mycolicibacterium vaccae TaxID=1810 RepID=UPI003D066462